MAEQRQTEDGLDLRQTEDGLDIRITEGGQAPSTVISTIVKYNQSGSSNTRERPIFNYEFPTQLYMIVTD